MKTKMTVLALSLSMFWTALAFAAPAKGPAMVPVAVCNNGKTMYGTNPSEHRGACSGNGGVASFADGSPVKSHARKTQYK